jgi:thiamine-monophosphate kinase
MTSSEFNIIQQFFYQQTVQRAEVVLGIGDDGAIVQVPAQQELVITVDTLVENIHYLKNTAPFDIGFKALAVNLSDLAAMGATPAWITLALTLPEINEGWLQEFCRGLFTLSNQHKVQLIGGDLTRGPSSITIQAHGFIPCKQALQRHKAQAGDLIYVTHTLGDAALGLLFAEKKVIGKQHFVEYALARLNRPEPRIHIGEKLRNVAHAAIDISDGLAADLGHILEKSRVGAIIQVDQLPLSPALRESVPYEQAIALALNGGDDYELCFTLPTAKKAMLDFNCTCIGKITEKMGLDLRCKDGSEYTIKIAGYQHF